MISGGGYNKYLVGATDRALEGDWRWLNNEPVDGTKWRNTEPNNLYGKEHCAIFGTDKKLNDLECKLLKKFVCEKSY